MAKLTAEADRVLRENLASFDAEVAYELENDGERADLWTDIDVPVEALRALLDELDRLREANRKLHRRAQLAEAVNQSCEGILDAWCRFLRNRENRQFENTLFHMALGDIMSSRKRIAARALSTQVEERE